MILFPDRGSCISTANTQRQLVKEPFVGLVRYRFQTKAVVSIPLPHGRGNYTGNYMRNPLWVFYDTVSGQRQLFQYRFQTEYDIVSKGSDIIPLPDRASYITTVTHRARYMKNPLWVLSRMIPFLDKGSCVNTFTRQRQLY